MSADPIERLYRAADCARAAQDEQTRWLGECILRAIVAAPELDLLGAFGLSSHHGGEPWWRTARRYRRNAALRALAQLIEPAAGVPRQARAVHDAVRRYEMDAWPRDREVYRQKPPADAKRALLHEIMAQGLPVPKLKRLKAILAGDD